MPLLPLRKLVLLALCVRTECVLIVRAAVLASLERWRVAVAPVARASPGRLCVAPRPERAVSRRGRPRGPDPEEELYYYPS